MGNASYSRQFVTYDTTPPENPAIDDFTITEGDRSIVLKWKSGIDFPIADNILRYDIKVTLTKSYFADMSRTKTFSVYQKDKEEFELKIDELQDNEKVTFSLKTVDKARNQATSSQTVVGYTGPEKSEIIDPNNPAKQTIITQNGIRKRILNINLKPVQASAYRLQYKIIDANGVEAEGYRYSNLLTEPNWSLEVKPHYKYSFWVQTYNQTAALNAQSGQTVLSQPIEIKIHNISPTVPTLTVPSFVGEKSITLTHQAGKDEDGDTLVYYNKISENGKIIVDLIDGETESTTFELANLKDGKLYTWQLGVWDRHELDEEGNRKIVYSAPVSFTADQSAPMISVNPVPAQGSYINIENVTVIATDSVSGLKELNYKWRIPNKEDDPTAVIEEGKIHSGDFLVVKDGEYDLVLTAVDNVGNTENQTYLYRNDSTSPVIEKVQINALMYDDDYIFTTSTI